MSYYKKKLAIKKLRKRRIPLADDSYRAVLRAKNNREMAISQHNKPLSHQPIDEPLADDRYRAVLRAKNNRKKAISQHNNQKPMSHQSIDEPLADDSYQEILRANNNQEKAISQHNNQKPLSHQPMDEEYDDNLQISDMPGSVSAAPFGFSIVFVDFEISRLDRMQNETLRPTDPWNPNVETAKLGRYVTVIQSAKRCYYNIMQTQDSAYPLRYEELALCLELVREHMLANGCKRVALEKLCCNKSIPKKKRLGWSIVRNMIYAAFAYSDIEEVLIYCEDVPMHNYNSSDFSSY